MTAAAPRHLARSAVPARRARAVRPVSVRGSQSLYVWLAALVILCIGFLVPESAWPGGRDEHGSASPATSRDGGPLGESEDAQATSAGDPSRPVTRWRHVLESLLARRASAYAEANAAALASVYLPGSAVLERDREILRDWHRRGLTVRGASVRLHSVHLVDHSPDRAVLRVVDRLAGAVAVATDGSTRALPHDRPTRHRVLLVKTVQGWRISSVRGLNG